MALSLIHICIPIKSDNDELLQIYANTYNQDNQDQNNHENETNEIAMGIKINAVNVSDKA